MVDRLFFVDFASYIQCYFLNLSLYVWGKEANNQKSLFKKGICKYALIHCKDWTQSSNVVVWHNFPPKNKDISEAIWELYQAKGKQEVRLMILRWRNVSVQSTMVNCEMCNCWLRHNLSSGAPWTFAQPWLVLGCCQYLHNICKTMVASGLLPTFAP